MTKEEYSAMSAEEKVNFLEGHIIGMEEMMIMSSKLSSRVANRQFRAGFEAANSPGVKDMDVDSDEFDRMVETNTVMALMTETMEIIQARMAGNSEEADTAEATDNEGARDVDDGVNEFTDSKAGSSLRDFMMRSAPGTPTKQ